MNWRIWRKRVQESWRAALVGAAICAVAGPLVLKFVHTFTYLSYDLLFHPALGISGETAPDDVVIIEMDDESYRELGQLSVPSWDRNLHAKVLDRLTADKARVVVFDVVFVDPSTPSADTNLARAIRENGRVILAASLDRRDRGQIHARMPTLPKPDELLPDPEKGWGITESYLGSVIRQYFVGNEFTPSMPWAAAKVAGATVTKALEARQPETWLNFYGPPLTLKRIQYHAVHEQTANFFRDKCVFIGARPKTLKVLEEPDAFPTPYWKWEELTMPGVELGATAFLNIMRQDGLRQVSWLRQYWIIVICGALVGGILGFLRPLPALGCAVLVIVVCVVTSGLLYSRHLWWSWPVVAFAQVPCGLLWSLRNHVVRLRRERDKLEWTLAEATRREEASKAMAPAAAAGAGQAPAVAVARPAAEGLIIPDHTMVRRVGKGAYGEVWLARNAIGAYHAVKLVQRRNFPADEPYEREFRGIQKFMPISRSHVGLVHVLHVGRNDTEQFFFYIMEAGDDVVSGQNFNPETYIPKSLTTEMEQRGPLPPEECLELGLALSAALEHLHKQQLIHRDIKPGNIIFVNGAPKFADIGLVTDIRSVGRDVSYLGTEGYIAPEGPGTASADVFALGKVLYEAAMGRDRCLFPEIPTSVLEQPRESLVRRLNDVIFKACENAVNDRYQTAAELHADLLRLIHLAGKQRKSDT